MDEELARGPEGKPCQQDPGDEAHPPERVDRTLEERANHRPHADDQEKKAEHVGQAGEGVGGVGEADDGRDEEKTAEERPGPAHRHVQPRQRDVLDADAQEHQPDENADGGHGRVVELEDDQRGGKPCDPGDEQDPPVAGELARAYAQGPYAGHFELRGSGVFTHDDLQRVVLLSRAMLDATRVSCRHAFCVIGADVIR